MHQDEDDFNPRGSQPGVSEQFGEMIRDARSRLGWSQRTLARTLQKAGLRIDPSAITRIETGQREPRLNEAVAISNILSLNLDALTFSDSAVFRRSLVVISDAMVEARKSTLRALLAVEDALDSTTPDAERELVSVSQYDSVVDILGRQIELFYLMVDEDRQKGAPNFSAVRGPIEGQLKQKLVEAVMHRILRPAELDVPEAGQDELDDETRYEA